VAVLGGKIYVLGGEEGWDHYHDTIESYDPALDKWDIVGEMGSSRSWLSCVGLTVKMESGTTAEEKSWRWGISVSNPVQMAATRRPPRTSASSSNEARGPNSETQNQPLVISQQLYDNEAEVEEVHTL